MPTLASNNTLVRGDLTGALMEYDPSNVAFISRLLFRPFSAPEQAGVFGVTPLETMLAEANVRRNNDGSYPQSDGKLTEMSYSTEDRGQVARLDDRKSRMYRRFFDFEKMETLRLYGIMRRAEEIELAAKLINTTTYPLSGNTGHTASVLWNVPATALPRTDARKASDGIWNRSGQRPNAAAMTYNRWTDMTLTEEIRDCVKYTREETIDPRLAGPLVARALGVKYLFISDAPTNTAAKNQTASISNIWDDDYVGFGRIAETDDIAEPCIGRTIFWDGDGSGLEVMERWYDNDKRGEMLRLRSEWQQKELMASKLWYLVKVV